MIVWLTLLLLLRCAGLPGEHLLQAGVARPSAELYSTKPQAFPDSTGHRQAEANLDPGHVLQEREARAVPWSDCRQPTNESDERRQCLVRQQVSKPLISPYRVSIVLTKFNKQINQWMNLLSGLSSDATARTTMGVTVKKCHMIMSGNDCWNRVCFSCCWKANNELADVTLSGSLVAKQATVWHLKPINKHVMHL